MDKDDIRAVIIKVIKKNAATRKYYSEEWYTKWYDMAVEEDPNGVLCYFCSGINDFFDDCGWFYFPNPGCKNCYDGRTGRRWVKMHGVGDR